jgi:hypothetical protein
MWLLSSLLVAVVLAVVNCQGQDRSPAVEKIQLPQTGCVIVQEDFSKENSNWDFAIGTWQRRSSDGKPVLAQTANNKFNVALLKRESFADVDVTVRFRPISGKQDASGGIIFRAKDEKNYYVVRANALENNFRLYKTENGARRQITGVTVTPPALGQWHTLRVVAVGNHIQAYLNDQLLIDRQDNTYAAGVVGLWTKADSVTEFADLKIVGIAAGKGE